MREILTAISFLLVLVAPTVLAARASGMTMERKKRVAKKRRRTDPITLFGDSQK